MCIIQCRKIPNVQILQWNFLKAICFPLMALTDNQQYPFYRANIITVSPILKVMCRQQVAFFLGKTGKRDVEKQEVSM